jgi:hypothetical protein
MKKLHQNARKINYYVRMLVHDLISEMNASIKSDTATRRLTTMLTNRDDPQTLVNQLETIHRIPEDDRLVDHLTELISSLENTELSKCILNEINSRRRTNVPDDKVPWSVSFADYKPAKFTAWPVLHTSLDQQSPKPFWADADLQELSLADRQKINFNKMDTLDGKKVDRRSREGQFELSEGIPRNPRGRTGMIGRGLLGRFGPNLAADPIVSRWKKNSDGSIKQVGGKKVLEVVFIQRRDNHEWALPGGMVEPDSEVSMTLIREFREEALNICGQDKEKAEQITSSLKNSLFSTGETIYEGYVDDPRNTDHAWMETVAKNFHDDKGVTYDLGFKLEGGDDAAHAKWQECSSSLKLYASHTEFVRLTVQKRQAHW